MRSFFVIMTLLFSINAMTVRCDITGEYRCRGGRTGTVMGQGSSVEDAKINARDLARDICGGRVDYVRFIDNTSTC